MNKLPLKEQHLQWQNSQRDLQATLDYADETSFCQICYCRGNNECGHECMDNESGCALKDGVCPCCEVM